MSTKILERLCNEGREFWSNTIKFLLYKQYENIFDLIDFENQDIYSDPLLFAYYNNPENISLNKNILNAILLQGFKKNKKIKIQLDKHKKTYISNIGWISKTDETIEFSKEDMGIEKIYKIKDTNIEILKYPIDLLETFYDGNEVEIEEITKKQIENLTKAYLLIKKYVPDHFFLINNYAKKSVIFCANPNYINSFAHRRALGISFFNAYQINYDEVFFVDDIAHQTGHVLMHTMFFDKKKLFQIDDQTTLIQDYSINIKNNNDNRNVDIWFQALFTYYTSFLCLDKCIDANVFDKQQETEAIGRILLYIYRCYYDLNLIGNTKQDRKMFDKITLSIKKSTTESLIFSNDGQKILNIIKNKYAKMFNKYYMKFEHLSFKNQTYNFDLTIFLNDNPTYDL
ncbi:hypothetical protein [Flavobacterium crassostreae]|uniref:HEXXH motif domain-containing protein n=1 Tax=Flavobacterium crassostreae TaxID=1763534 RepID=A0A1B9E7I0_9FLAO|nr:hypothetical protein [Flavobacterium crassostreae]OCB77905.1 hypothetical protein LPBF_02855 [Flavobacterium crassostreae]